MKHLKHFLFNAISPILTYLPRTPYWRKIVGKLYLWICREDVVHMLRIYNTYQTAINVTDVAKILQEDGWSMKKIELIHELCLRNGLISCFSLNLNYDN